MARRERPKTDNYLVPDGQCGGWAVERFSVSEEDAKLFNMRATFSFTGGGRHITPGQYVRLTRGGKVIMSNTPSELDDHREVISKAQGRVLLAGLGLGVVLEKILQKDNVETATVIEKSPEVISLVGGFFGDPRVAIIEADIFDWTPPKGVRYDVAWFDIWDDICADNLGDMKKLHRKFGRNAAWKGSWCRRECERHARH